MLYDLIVQLIGVVPVEFEFIYGLATLVACVFGILLLFSPIIFVLKLGGR